MNNITVKKTDGTTNVVFVAKRPAGSGTPAVYVQDAQSLVSSFRSSFTLGDRKSQGAKGAQKVEATFNRPVTQVINGVETQVGSIPLAASFTIPSTLSDVENGEAVDQFLNLLSTPEVRAFIKSGFAPRG